MRRIERNFATSAYVVTDCPKLFLVKSVVTAVAAQKALPFATCAQHGTGHFAFVPRHAGGGAKQFANCSCGESRQSARARAGAHAWSVHTRMRTQCHCSLRQQYLYLRVRHRHRHHSIRVRRHRSHRSNNNNHSHSNSSSNRHRRQQKIFCASWIHLPLPCMERALQQPHQQQQLLHVVL